MSDQRVAVELLLGQVLHEDVTRFGSWTGIRRGADKAIINVLPFQDSEIFKIIQSEYSTKNMKHLEHEKKYYEVSSTRNWIRNLIHHF